MGALGENEVNQPQLLGYGCPGRERSEQSSITEGMGALAENEVNDPQLLGYGHSSEYPCPDIYPIG